MSWLLRLACVCLAAACTASQASPLPAATVRPSVAPAGWKVITRTESSDTVSLGLSKISQVFRIAIPPTWLETSLDDDSAAAGDRALASANATYAKAVEAQQTGPSGHPPLAFSALDPDARVVAGIVTTTLYVTGQHVDRVITPSAMAKSMQRYREETIGAVVQFRGNTVIDGRDAVVLAMQYELQGSGGEHTTVASVQYIVVRDMYVYIIELTGALDEMNTLLPVFDSIARTFKVL